MKNVTKTLLVAAVAVVLALPYANATTAQLYLWDGTGSPVYVTDNGSGDSDATVGVINYSGPLNSYWSVNVEVAITKPALGDAIWPRMDITTTALSLGTGTRTLTVMFSDIDFGPFAGGTWWLYSAMTTGGTVDVVETYYDTGNTLFATTTLVNSLGPFNGPSASGDDYKWVGPIAYPYSITMVQKITHYGVANTITTGNSELETVPDAGSTLGLLGLAMASLGLLRRKVR